MTSRRTCSVRTFYVLPSEVSMMTGFSIVRSLFLILHLASGPSSAFVIGRSSTRSWFPRSRRAIATKATVGSIVEIDCTLRPEGDFVPDMLFDGIALDESDEPKRLKFCLGQGNYVPGLHDLVLSMEVGEIVKDIRLDAGWGDWNPALNVSISLEALEGNGLETTRIKVGTELLMANGMRALVTHRSDNAIVVDANPPLSGASYLATVKLLAANDGPKDLLYAAESGSSSRYQVATVALGCFWGAELAYMREPGVVGTKVGYTQGTTENPTYEEVCSGSSMHTEAVMVFYDTREVSYERLVQLAMDRLGENKYLLNQVGNDKGTQYRHGIYFHNDAQKKVATEIVGSFGDDCFTEVLPATIFYDAEAYHMQYLLKDGQSA